MPYHAYHIYLIQVKYRAALANNIPVVVVEWLLNSIESGTVLPTEKYTLVSQLDSYLKLSNYCISPIAVNLTFMYRILKKCTHFCIEF